MKRLATVLLILLIGLPAVAQMVPQNPSPMTDSTRPHPRIAQTEVPGRRVELTALKGAVLFVSPKVKTAKPVPLVINFHGAPWLIQHHLAESLPRAALITINLGSGSRAYDAPFAADRDLLKTVIDEAGRVLELKKGWSSLTLVGFSAGYGAIRAILRQPENFVRVDNVLLLDGIHASYVPEGKVLGDGGIIREEDVDSYVAFAREAGAGRKTFVITHSELFPGTYASTTECVDHLLKILGLKRTVQLKNGPIGMQQLSVVKAKGFKILGYAGNTGADHGDHLHAMPAWLKSLRIK
jgi:hypothetical protein